MAGVVARAPIHWPMEKLAAIPARWWSAALIALAVGLALTEPRTLSATTYYLFALWLGFLLAPKRRLVGWQSYLTLACVLVIVASALLAVPVSAFNNRELGATIILALATLILLPLFWVSNTREILLALIPVYYLQAALTCYQWMTEFSSRPPGLAVNANAGSSLLLLGTVYLASHPRLKWLAVPLLAAIPFGGSRWVAVAAALVLGGIFIWKRVPWRYLLVGFIAAITLVVWVAPHEITVAYRLSDSIEDTASANKRDAAWRLTGNLDLTSPLTLLPQGFVRESQLHNVPIRMAVETGALSGLAWIIAGLIALASQPARRSEWWMLLTICILSVMYYHTWIGPLGAFWWMLVRAGADGRLLDSNIKTEED